MARWIIEVSSTVGLSLMMLNAAAVAGIANGLPLVASATVVGWLLTRRLIHKAMEGGDL